MSHIISMDAFRLDKAKPVSTSMQSQLDRAFNMGALGLALSLLMPAPIRNARTAEARDIQIRQERIKLALDAAAEFVNQVMSELNENLEITNTVDMTDFNSAMHDLRSDLNWLLERAKELE